MEPYYVAAFAWWRLEYLFRNTKLDSKYKSARFHILLATRIIGNPLPLPKLMNGKEIDTYCKPILEKLWDVTKSDDLIYRAAELVNEAVSGNLDNDYIRTEPTTAKVIAKCREATSVSLTGDLQ